MKDLPNVVIMPLDVSDSQQIKETCQKALADYDVDVLLNNAGYGVMAPLERMPEDAIHKVFNTDVLGTMLVTQQFIPHFKKRRAGAILTTTSLAAIIALPRDSVYGAAKRAQQGMLESLYYEMKPFNVFVKAMIPGGTKTNFQTPINDRTGYEEAAAHQQEYLLHGNEEFPKMRPKSSTERLPMKRIRSIIPPIPSARPFMTNTNLWGAKNSRNTSQNSYTVNRRRHIAAYVIF